MNAPIMQSVQLIRRRLIWLLMKVIGSVVVITVILLLGLIGLLFNAPGTLDVPSFFYVLEAYYLARGSWEGVERLPEKLGANVEDDEDEEWEHLVLLDQENRVLLDQGAVESSRIGELYVPTGKEISYAYQVDGQEVGTLVVETWLYEPSFLGPLPEVAGISFLTVLLTLLIGLLLMRRLVTPLADIMAVAQQVTAGDLSARVEVSGPDDFRTLTDSFNRMVATLEKNSQERRRLLADIAHELRTPLSILRGRLEGILDGIYAPSEAQIAKVLEESLLIEKLVEDLRLLTLAEARQLRLQRQKLDLAEQAERMVELFAPEAEEKNISLTIQSEPKLPLVMADPQRIAQVIGNLVANALRYIPPGSHIKLTIQHHKEGVALSISDNGPGVPEADLPHLFDRFWRAEKSRTRASGGTGLGLAITKQLIEAQNGHIDAQNNPDGGLCVTFILPSQSDSEQ